MSHTATVEKNHTPVADGWSRDPDGTIHMMGMPAFQLFGRLVTGDVPAYAANLVVEDGMDFQDFIDKNGIVLESTPMSIGF